MAPLEPWEKVLVSLGFLESTHGQFTCIQCHGGQQSPDKETAHTGLLADPIAEGKGRCDLCHSDVTNVFADSVHATLSGYQVAMQSRSIPENHPALQEAYNNHCAKCHSTCSDCHISQPKEVGGGFLDGHNFVKTPPMTRTCTACHGSRVGNEYLGKHEDIPGDVHFRVARMNCVSCHSGDSLHSTPQNARGNRYWGEQSPACSQCHSEVGSPADSIAQHALHGDKLSCQVCHSVQYTSCDGCHVAISETTGNPFFRTEGTYLTFFIGKNPLKNEYRPYDYVPVRHVPISPTSYEYYGQDLLVNFDLLPTWMYATPHNIQRKTPQNQACNNCHGNLDIFLTADKVKDEELTANRSVIVDQVPEAIPGQ